MLKIAGKSFLQQHCHGNCSYDSCYFQDYDASKNVCHSWLVCWLPWSKWKRTLFFGILRHKVINNASKNRSVAILDFIDQSTTRRENRSITTARYNHPLNRTGFVGESIFWETILMTKLKYTPEIRERAVQLLIESEKDYPST